nr:hypothetical protein [Candidatus Dependentiae bacterium]
YMNSRVVPSTVLPEPPYSCPVNTTLVPRFIGQQPLETCNEDPRNQPCVFKYNRNCTTSSLREALSGKFVFGDMQTPWKFGRFDFCPRTKTAVADIEVITGYNFLAAENSHMNVSAIVVVPTGNRPKSRYIFEPMVGSAKHWQLGGVLTAHYSFFIDSDPQCYNMGFYIDAQCTHLFPSNQIRSFDFTDNGLLSRYILLKEFDIHDMYTGNTINAINFATRNCKVTVPLKTDISAKWYLASKSWEFDIGYNFYFRSKEHLCIRTQCPCPLDERRFGIKGLEGVCCTEYRVENGIVQGPIIQALPLLNTTQSRATMFQARLPRSAAVPENPEDICLSWNSRLLTDDVPLNQLTDFILADTTASPEFVTCNDLNPSSAAQGAMMTHKFFGHINYTFSESCYNPFLGIGGEIEFDGHHNNALQQWAAWIKGGISF